MFMYILSLSIIACTCQADDGFQEDGYDMVMTSNSHDDTHYFIPPILPEPQDTNDPMGDEDNDTWLDLISTAQKYDPLFDESYLQQ